MLFLYTVFILTFYCNLCLSNLFIWHCAIVTVIH